MGDELDRPWWRTPSGLVLGGFLVVAGYFLLTQHTAHVFGVLPWLFILACPVMHMFHHHGHSGHHGHGDRPPSPPPPPGERP